MAEKKKRDKQAKLLEKVKFLQHILDNYFESLKPKYVGWSNEALALEATEFLKRSAPLGRETIPGWRNSRFKLGEQAQREVHYFFSKYW